MLRSTFPRGWPGVGLLLLRVVAGMILLANGYWAAREVVFATGVWCVAVLAMTAGAVLMVGFCTTIAAVLSSVGAIAAALGWIPWRPSHPVAHGVTMILLVSVWLAIALLGPGSISIDARRRGHREIVFPANSRSRHDL